MALRPRCASVAALGVTTFGLLLDDIPRTLQHARGPGRLRDLVAAHVHVVDRSSRRSGSGTRLTVCPVGLLGHRHRATTCVRLGEGMDPRIGILLDGSRHLLPDPRPRRRRDVRALHQPAGHLLGQLSRERRGHELRAPHRSVPGPRPAPVAGRGRASLPMLWSCSNRRRSPSRPSPTTFGRPGRTTPRRAGDGRCATSWARRTWTPSRCSRTTCAARACPRTMRRSCGRALESFLFRVDRGDRRERVAAAAELAALADRLAAAAAHLLRGPVVNRALMDEARPWLVAFELGAQAMRAIADLAAAGPAGTRRARRPATIPGAVAPGTRARVR